MMRSLLIGSTLPKRKERLSEESPPMRNALECRQPLMIFLWVTNTSLDNICYTVPHSTISSLHIPYLPGSFCDCFGPRTEMLSAFLSPRTFVFFHLLITTTYAFPAYPQLVSSLVAHRHNVSSPNTLGSLNVSRTPSTEALKAPPGPLWPVTCNEEVPPHFPINGTDCLHIAKHIESTPGATSYRLYKASEGLSWAHGNCFVFLKAWYHGNTDVFKPILISENIRRVVEKCNTAVSGLGGVTPIGPRLKFEMDVTYVDPGIAMTVATE